MKRVPILYNKVTQKVIRMEGMTEQLGIPEEFFQEAGINGELDLFVHVTGRKDGKEWLKWHIKAGEWYHHPNPPDQVKLARMLV